MSDGSLPNFRIPHAEKIEWMIETNGWALEVVPGYAYTIGFPERFDFPEVAIFGLTPVAAKGLLDLVASQLDAGVEIPIDVPLVGLFDNDLRCLFASIDMDQWSHLLATGVMWHRGAGFAAVQLLWPDRQGFLPHEDGVDDKTRAAQPVIGRSPG